MDGPTAAVIVSGVLTAGSAIVVAIIKLVPQRTYAAADGPSEEACHRRLAALESRVAVVEANFGNMGRSFDELRREIREIRALLLEFTGRKGG